MVARADAGRADRLDAGRVVALVDHDEPGDTAFDRLLEDHVGREQAQIAIGRVLVVHRHRGHQPVERQHARVVGDHQRRPGLGQVFDPADLNPEPRVEKHSQQRQKDCVVEVRIESELVDGVVAHHPLANEFSDTGDALGKFGRRLLRRRHASGRGSAVVNFADHSGDLLGRGASA